jgi:type IX secretion system PorP/SprF family membrane protein
MIRLRISVNKTVLSREILLLLFLCCCYSAYGQQMPFNPVSYRIFSPFLLNPAVAGSKDYTSFDILAGFNGKSYSQVVSGNARIARKTSGYGTSGSIYSFTNIGTGGYAYNDFNSTDSIRDAGISAALSYHIPLNNKALSFLSIGASVKGMYHFYYGNSDLALPYKEFYFPNVDVGIYLYNPNSYAGISATNLLDPPVDTATLTNYHIPISRQYNFLAGYKFVISRALNLVLEPSVIIHTNDTLAFDIKENIEPALKLYVENFCIGTYFNDFNKISFLFQYRYPKFYVGAFFALPKNSPFFKKSLTAEVAFGINFSHNKSGYTKYGHW